jgi:alcohol dehydrogenase (NADP+)
VWNDSHNRVIESCKKSLADLQIDKIDLYLLHWPFSNTHTIGASTDERHKTSRPFSLSRFLSTWEQLEKCLELGLVKNIGMSNITIPKLELVWNKLSVKPVAIESEMHPSYRNTSLFNWCERKNIISLAYSPLGSPSRPKRDRTKNDINDFEMPEILAPAKRLGVHPATICLKWASARGQIPIPFSVKKEKIISNYNAVNDNVLLTDNEMQNIENSPANEKIIKGQVFLWPNSSDWRDLWDFDGKIKDLED